MKTAIIVAHDENLVIGKDGKLPWYLPEDLKYFKKTTLGYAILMGRGVYEEIGEKPLPGRKNVVLSKKKWNNCISFDSIDKALKYLKCEDKIFVIGGGMVYSALLAKADELYITEVDGEHEGDTNFPDYRVDIGSIWQLKWSEPHDGYQFKIYTRVSISE